MTIKIEAKYFAGTYECLISNVSFNCIRPYVATVVTAFAAFEMHLAFMRQYIATYIVAELQLNVRQL